MKMKVMYSLAVTIATVALLVTSVTVQASKLDDQIEVTAQQSYVFKTYLKNDSIRIKSEHGVVSLLGTVSEESHKLLAQETVAGLSGVKRVDNRLEVQGPFPPDKSEAGLKDKVKIMLLLHQSVGAELPDVDVKGGTVTLKGEVSSQKQKEWATEYTADVEGVTFVNNQMTVAKTPKKTGQTTAGEKIDDASITAQVKVVLLSHRSTSALKTRVETKNGVVTLSGKAKSAAEKNAAAKFANDVKGVKSVKNRMTIGK
jgi:osmotically-inducible protein OsmY